MAMKFAPEEISDIYEKMKTGEEITDEEKEAFIEFLEENGITITEEFFDKVEQYKMIKMEFNDEIKDILEKKRNGEDLTDEEKQALQDFKEMVKEFGIKGKAYKKFEGKLKAKKNFIDSMKINNPKAVYYLQQRGIINGYGDGSFGPENAVNRAEALKIILEALGMDIEDVSSSDFSDVDVSAWFVKYVEKAKEMGIVDGYEDGTFKPARAVNKVELLKILFKAFEIDLSNYEVAELYPDVDPNAWYAEYLQYAKDNGLIDADENGNINPGEFMTRDEFSEVVYRLLEQQEALVE